MKKVLLALGLAFASAPAYSTSELPTERLSDILEFESGTTVPFEQRRFFLEGSNCLRLGIQCGNDEIFRDPSVEARYCITRCTGTGKDRVCYEVCYED